MTPDGRPSEEELVRRFREGDDSALQLLLERNADTLQDSVLKRMPAYLKRRLAVSDVIQETHIAVLGSRREFEFRGNGSFRNWLLTIADNKIRNAIQAHLRAAKRSARREVSRDQRPDTGLVAGRDATPSEVAMGAELAHLARDALRTLPPDYRRVLELSGQHTTLKEVAARMGRSHAAVRQLYGRALARYGAILDGLRGVDRE